MDIPVLLPKKFEYLRTIKDDNELCSILEKEPRDLILFFENACYDHMWAINHLSAIKTMLEWLTEHFFSETLSLEAAQRAKNTIYENNATLFELIPKDLAVKSGGRTSQVNSMLFALSSGFLLNLLQHQCIEKNRKTVELPKVSETTFEAIVDIIQTGKVDWLWKKEREVILNVIKESSELELKTLEYACASVLARYITSENAVEMLLMAHENRWENLYRESLDFITNSDSGVKFYHTGLDALAIEFLDYDSEATDIFFQLKGIVTQVTCHSDLPAQPFFSTIMTNAKSLVSLDISESKVYSDRLLDIPSSIIELNLSRCPWLTDESLNAIIQRCPLLKILRMDSNVQISYKGWAALKDLSDLEQLSINRCHQVSDEDFAVISKGCGGLEVVELQECRKLTDGAIIDLARRDPHIRSIDLSRTNIGDPSVIELVHRCRQLKSVDLSKCLNISDLCILATIKEPNSIEEINITHCNIAEKTIEIAREQRPHLKIIH